MKVWCPRTEMTLGASPGTPCSTSCFMTLSAPEQFTIQIYLCLYLHGMQMLGVAPTCLAAQTPDFRR